MARKGWLVLADGTRFEGTLFGAEGKSVVGEVVFTTGMTGYQEVLTDPSYCEQIVTMTAPHIGNTGVTPEDDEAERPTVAGFVVRERSPRPSNWRARESLEAYLHRHGVVAIEGLDTRALTLHLREHGVTMGALGAEDPATLHDRALAAPPMTGRNLAEKVGTSEPYEWTEGLGDWRTAPPTSPRRHVVAIDFGAKRAILRCLVEAGCRVTVVPPDTSAEQVRAMRPDALFLSNGPGDPAAVEVGRATVEALLGELPIFGICLGHQILALALGGRSYKLKFGHRGLNQPVQDLSTGRVEVTSQNHGFAIDVASLRGRCTVSHVHLNDGTCEGIEHPESGAFGVQYHPEASAGPHDARYLFARFVERIDTWPR